MNFKQKIEKAIPHDKLLHFTAGLLLALPAFLCVWVLFTPIVVGLLLELYDKYVRKTKFDYIDWLATLLGCVPVIVILLLL